MVCFPADTLQSKNICHQWMWQLKCNQRKSSEEGTDGLIALQRDTCLLQYRFLPGLSTCFHSIKIHFVANTSIVIINVKAWIPQCGQMRSYSAKNRPVRFLHNLAPLSMKRYPYNLWQHAGVLFTYILTSVIVMCHESHHCGVYFYFYFSARERVWTSQTNPKLDFLDHN